jgi:type IX secretion system PorP/SprF family membrane protein
MYKLVFYLKYCLITCLFFVFGNTFAQQDAQYSQYMYNSLYNNPATAGINSKVIELGIINRQQWLGYAASFDAGGSPTSTFAYISAPIKALHGGLGLQVQNDKLGPLGNFSASLSYALHEEIENGKISFGIQAGVYNMSIDFSSLRPRETNDVLLQQRTTSLSQFRPDFSAGIQLTKKKYYIGIAASHLLKPSFDFGGVSSSRLNIHTNITGGMNFDLTREISIKPTAIIRTDFNSFSTQISATASYQNFVYFGLGMRNSMNVDDAIIFAGINILQEKLHIGYAFDYVVSGVTAKAPTSHEVIVRYNIPMPLPIIAPIIRTPRFRF